MKRLMRRSLFVGLVVAGLAAASGPALAAGPISGRHKTGRGESASTNWSGYAAYNSTFSHVVGDWTVPTANCSAVRGKQTSIASAFVGIDGFLSNTVEQGGTDTDCLGKTPFYVAWYEFFPARAVFLDQGSYPVDAGDRMHAEVSVSGSTATITLQNLSRGWTLTPSPSLSSSSFEFSSAEWILEAPTNRLTNFGTINFSNAAATGGGTTNGAISDFTNDKITMLTRNGRTARATPSTLTSGGTAFSVNFNHQ
jgi:peptidase A4-like protein